MRKISKKARVVLVAMFAITLGNVAVTLYSQGHQNPSQGEINNKDQMLERVRESKSRAPIVYYNAPEPADPEKRAKRKARNEQHNNSMLGVKGGLNASPNSGDEIVLRTNWEVNTPQIPAAQSDIVVTGEILDANAYISADKNGVYSEFALRVEEILKKNNMCAVSPGAVISVERQGGRVRYPSGRVEWYRIALQGMPLINHRYVLFLKRIDEDSFSIVTGYELRERHVYALDSASQFRAFEGTDEAPFLQSVREAISKQ
ncbi:MAG: hypothetical protein LC754_19245 [Acidobacteria bacterium]|nr:hypothetical protein [Acidobacteriota bacterium]